MNRSANYQSRRKHLLSQLAPHEVLLIAAAPMAQRNADNDYPYRQDSDFYYLTGFEEPQACLLLGHDLASEKSMDSVLFCRPRDPQAEAWTGSRLGLEDAKQQLALATTYDIAQIAQYLPDLLVNKTTYYLHLPQSATDQVHQGYMTQVSHALRERKLQLAATPLTDVLAKMRLYKDDYELACMRRAADISVAAHQGLWRGLAASRSSQLLSEAQCEAHLQFEITAAACEYAYPAIVAGAERGLMLHYMDNDKTLKPNDLLLVDAGAEYACYAADITRTVPCGGVFSTAQAAIYQLVLDAQLAVIAAIKPGLEFSALQTIAVEVLTAGLIKLGLLEGDCTQLIADKAYARFYMHGVSHWLGLDVHDAGGRVRADGSAHVLAENMCLTVEPGLYIPNDSDIEEKWRGIAVRIEDDIRVTADGAEVLTAALPKEIKAIEDFFASCSH